MDKFAGKYEFVKSENFEEHFKALGVPDDKRPKNPAERIEISVEGNKCTFSGAKISHTLTLNEEVEKTLGSNSFKFLLKLDGDKLVEESIRDGGSNPHKRVISLAGNELTIKHVTQRPEVPEAIEVYKKV